MSFGPTGPRGAGPHAGPRGTGPNAGLRAGRDAGPEAGREAGRAAGRGGGPAAAGGAIKGASRGPGEIDYRLARQSLISEYRKGRLAQHEVCDAHPELMRNAQQCAEPSRLICPICEDANLVLVTYVFGPRLPASGRCITSKKELKALASRAGEFSCYVVEVCPACSWNHLARTFLLNPARSA